VDVQWSQTDAEAIDFATRNNVHLLIVDDTLPPAGGIEAVRRIRRIGLTTPCLYVCNDPAPRLLSDAIKLDVFSVVDGDTRQREQLAAMIVRIALRLYQIQLPAITGLN
jgi:DNA-binding NarL/FixJ family response regulator